MPVAFQYALSWLDGYLSGGLPRFRNAIFAQIIDIAIIRGLLLG
ncbi:hypothetical protein [Xenorhabdus szentirmaii]|nr:hypothetical protein [Xenorhabdus szentirmaii]